MERQYLLAIKVPLRVAREEIKKIPPYYASGPDRPGIILASKIDQFRYIKLRA